MLCGMTEPKIALAVVHPGTVAYGWHESVLRTLRAFPGQFTIISVQCGVLIAGARNKVLDLFLESENDYLLSTDSDIVWDPGAFQSLLEADLPIVSAAYHGATYNGKTFPVVSMRGEGSRLYRPEDFPVSDTPVEVFGVGMGFCLIKREVAEALAPVKELWPYAEVMYGPQAIGEDITFCMRAAKKGYKTFLMPSVTVGHTKTMVV